MLPSACNSLLLSFAALAMLAESVAIAEAVRVDIVVTENGQAAACRIHLQDAAGKPVAAPGVPFWRDHFVCDGNVQLQLASGKYKYLVERGPQYARRTGQFEVADQPLKIRIEMQRIAHLTEDGWHAGDLHIHRAVEEIPLLMQAEDLDVAPVITWWNNRNLWRDRALPKNPLVKLDNRFYHVMAGEDEREGGALLYFHLRKPLEISGSSREYPSPMKFLAEARKNDGVWIDIEKPFWWDVPVWLASGQVDSIGLANNHMCHSRMYESEAWGFPRDTRRLPAPRGNGFWTQEIYYHLLNAGLRLSPSAGSASGVLPNPVGYNRVYVHTGDRFSYKNWWAGLKAGRSFVTNGPLLICRANGKLPGHVFSDEKELDVAIDIDLISNDNIPAIEIIKNGKVLHRLDVGAKSKRGVAATATFDESGWFLIRAIADEPRTFRFASTAPFYVEIGSAKRRISKQSAQFFLDWAVARSQRVGNKLKDANQLREVLQHHASARTFWQQRVAAATAP